MIVIENKAMCCGCTACYSICPKHCIVMKTDKEGFKYPFVDKANCIQCSLCEKTCPILYEGKKNGLLGAVAVQNKQRLLYTIVQPAVHTLLSLQK